MALGKLPESDVEGDDEGGLFAEINITPLTDIFLVMLIIFMVASSAAAEKVIEKATSDQRSGLNVNLPTGSTQDVEPGQNSLVVAIPKDGKVVVNGSEIPENDLDNLFRSAFAKDKKTQVLIKADESVDVRSLVGIMERARKVGLSKLAIATRGGG